MSQLIDSFHRQFSYLRLSITDLCNFRCTYCLPNGCHKTIHDYLTLKEIQHVVTAFAELGITKIRITGGEPTLRKDFLEIANLISHTPGITQCVLTTNGYKLFRDVRDYFQAGISSINISIDSLNSDNFKKITGHNKLGIILQGIDRAFEIGFKQIKVNTVLLRGCNSNELDKWIHWVKDKPITVRFIELMQTGTNQHYFKKHHLRSDFIENKLLATGWQINLRSHHAGPAKVYSNPEYIGKIGVIAPYAKNFCQSCNRLRVSSRGKLHLCLFGELGYSLRNYLQSPNDKTKLQDKIKSILNHKKISHFLHDDITGATPHLASIGG